MNQEKTESSPALLSLLWDLLVHILAGTSVFLIIALVAVGLDFLVSWLSGKGVDPLIIKGLKIGEYFLLVCRLNFVRCLRYTNSLSNSEEALTRNTSLLQSTYLSARSAVKLYFEPLTWVRHAFANCVDRISLLVRRRKHLSFFGSERAN